MKQKHYPKPPVFIFVTLIISFVLSAKMYFWWKESGNWLAILLAILFFILFIVCANPIVTWRTVVIDGGVLAVFIRFYKPITVNIRESIFQINQKGNKKVQSFIFKKGEEYIHIAPANYTKGNELSERIMAYVKKRDVSVNDISD